MARPEPLTKDELAALAGPTNCYHQNVMVGAFNGFDATWCKDCGRITGCKDSDPIPEAMSYEMWCHQHIVSFTCRLAHTKGCCEKYCGHCDSVTTASSDS